MKLRMALSALIVATIALGVAPSDAAARADWAKLGQPSDVRYLTIDHVPPSKRTKWEQIAAYQVAAASRGINLDRQVPQRVGESNAYRIDLTHLHWDLGDFAKVCEKYPYAPLVKGTSPLTIRADWLVYRLADTRDSDAYYRLLYGSKNIPKTDAEFLAFWGVDPEAQEGARFGWVETKSQVNLQETRFVEHFVGRAGRSVWRTKDANRVVKDTDPLEHLDGKFKHDGRELIAQIPKQSYKHATRGSAQIYALADGDGKIVHEAPVRLVEDHKRTLGQTAIINNASCVSCHEQGMNYPTANGLREALKVGELLYVYSKQQQEEIEDFHLGDSGTTLQRNNQDFAAFVTSCNGLGPAENAKLYRQGIKDYRAELTLQRAANEVYCSPEELKLALANASANYYVLNVRVVNLAHGKTCPRDTWEENYLAVAEHVKQWRAAK